MDNVDKKRTLQVMKLLMMEYIYVNNLKDDSKRGFVIDKMRTNIFDDDNVFEDVVSDFINDVNNHCKNLLNLVNNFNNVLSENSTDTEIKEQFNNLFKSVLPNKID